MRRVIGILMLAGVTLPTGVQAQAADERAAVGVVEGMFDAMREKDTAALERMFLPEARLVSTSLQNGEPTYRVIEIGDFIQGIGSSTAYLNEVVFDVEAQVSGTLATVWTGFNFFVGERLSHCGSNSFQLFRSADGWKILGVADTQTSEGCTP